MELSLTGLFKNKNTLLIIFTGVILLYIPFISKQFTGDDWLWLANAKKVLSEPEILFGRPMYGYFRPLNMLLIFLYSKIFGVHAVIFSAINILLHGLNTVLLWKVLKRFNTKENICNLSALFFGFYFLNASAIEWISVGHDLWVTLLTLLFTVFMLQFIEKPDFKGFTFILLAGLSATLFKESGFISLGIYFLLLLLKKKNPFSKTYRFYSLTIILLYIAYLLSYFKTRTIVDRELALGFDTLINMWYFLSYIITPISKRIMEYFPAQLYIIIKIIKVSAIIIIPIVFYYVFKKGKTALRFFVIWPVMFISTVAIFQWNLGLFDLYPQRTASRFMYSAIPGYAVVFAWFWQNIISSKIKLLNKKAIFIPLIFIFIMGNFLIIKQVSGVFIFNQKLSNEVINSLSQVSDIIAETDTLIVLTDDIDNTHQLIKSRVHLEAIVFVKFNKQISVQLKDARDFSSNDLTHTDNILRVGWQTSTNRLIVPE